MPGAGPLDHSHWDGRLRSELRSDLGHRISLFPRILLDLDLDLDLAGFGFGFGFGLDLA